MNAHLTDEQLIRYLTGEEDALTPGHLAECKECGAQSRRLLDMIGAARAHAERSSARQASFWARQRNEVRYTLAMRRPQHPIWAIAATITALVFISSLLFQTQRPRPEPPPSSQVQTISDDALLSEVNSTLSQDVPSALVPVQRLANEREQAELNRHN